MAALSLAACLAAPAQGADAPGRPDDRTIDLREAIALGARHPLARRAEATAQGDAAAARAAQRQATWPTAAVAGSAGRTDALSRVDSPIGSFNVGDHEIGQLQWAVRLPLWHDAARRRADAADRLADAALAAADRARAAQAMAAADRYFDLLALQAQVDAARQVRRSRQARFERIDAELAAGRTLRADWLARQIDVADADEDLLRLDSQLALARRALATACGLAETVRAAPLPESPASSDSSDSSDPSDSGDPAATDPPQGAGADAFVQQRLSERDDIVAARRRAESLGLSAAAAGAESRSLALDLVAQHTDRRGLPLLPRSENLVAVQLSMSLFDGSVEPREAGLLREREAEADRAVDAERAARLDYERLGVELATLQRRRDLALRRVESASLLLAQGDALQHVGREMPDAVIAIEAERRQQATRAAVLAIEIARTRLARRHVLGLPLLPPPAENADGSPPR